MGERGRFFPNVRAGLSGELFHERRERDSPAELRTLRSSDSLATTVEGRPNVESKQQMVKMSGSTYREVQSARGKPSVWKCAFGQAARAIRTERYSWKRCTTSSRSGTSACVRAKLGTGVLCVARCGKGVTSPKQIVLRGGLRTS